TRDMDLEKTIVQAIELSRRPPTPRVLGRGKKEFLTYDVGISFGDVRVENNLLKASFFGDRVKLTGTNKRPGLEGTVTVQDGKAYVRSTDFKFTTAVINFLQSRGIKPAFDINADSLVRNEYAIHANITGTPQKYDVNLTSEPQLSQADIALLLTVGVTSR